MRAGACWIIAALLGATGAADVLHLSGGKRYYGEVLREDARGVRFRIALDAEGKSTVVRTFPAQLIQRVARTGGLSTPPATTDGEEARESGAGDSGGGLSRRQRFCQMLREALELRGDDDVRAALAAMRRIAQEARPAEVAAVDALSRELTGEPFAVLLANTQFAHALERGEGRTFRLAHVPELAREVILELLRESTIKRLGRVYAGRPLSSWVRSPDAYDTLKSDALEMTRNAQLAAAFLSAQMRLDPRFDPPKIDIEARRAVAAQRDALVRFAAKVRSMTGYTALNESGRDDPTLEAARELKERNALKSADGAADDETKPASPPAPDEKGQAGESDAERP